MRPFLIFTISIFISCGENNVNQVHVLPNVSYVLDSTESVCKIGKIGKYNYEVYDNFGGKFPFSIPANINVISDSNSTTYFGIPIGFDSTTIEKLGFKKQILATNIIWTNYMNSDSSEYKIAQAFWKKKGQIIYILNFYSLPNNDANFSRILNKLSYTEWNYT